MGTTLSSRASRNRGLRRRLFTIAALSCYLASAGLALLGAIFGPMFIGKRPSTLDGPFTGPPFYEVVLLDLALAGICYGILRLGTLADGAYFRSMSGRPKSERPKILGRPSTASKPPVRSKPLRIGGISLLLLAVAAFVLGFQESLLTTDDGGSMWLVNVGIGMCSVPIGWYGGLMLKAARRPSRFGGQAGPGGGAVSGTAAFGGAVLYALCWLLRVLGCLVVLLGALLLGITVCLPGPGRLAFFEGLLIEALIALLGASVFRSGTAARNAARRRFGLATPVTAPDGVRLPRSQRLRGRIRWVARVIGLTLGATWVLGGVRLLPGDLLRAVSALGDVAIIGCGCAIVWLIGLPSRPSRATDVPDGDGVSRPHQYRVRGLILRILGLAMRIGGAVVLLVSVMAMRMGGSIGRMIDHNALPGYVIDAVFLVTGCMSAVVMRLASRPTMLANRYLANIVTSAQGLSAGSYVLYLRPFYQDVKSSGHIPGKRDQNFFNNPVSWILQSDRSHEERLAALFSEFGPLLAVGSPGEKVAGGAGALRMYLPLDNWQGTVGDLIDGARLVVLGTGPGPGTMWEYVEVLRRSHPTKLVLLITDPIEYKRFKASSIAEAEGVLHELKSRYGQSWEAPLLPELPVYSATKDDKALWFRAMIYFTDDFEPHLVLLNLPKATGNFRIDNETVKTRLAPVIDHLRGGHLLYVPEEWIS